jgi:hypothetical protein
MNSKNTTVAGILAIIVAVGSAALSLIQGTQPDWEATMTAIIAGIGLIFARDNNMTSEEAGAK